MDAQVFSLRARAQFHSACWNTNYPLTSVAPCVSGRHTAELQKKKRDTQEFPLLSFIIREVKAVAKAVIKKKN